MAAANEQELADARLAELERWQNDDAHKLLHQLWTKAVGEPNYVKGDWCGLEGHLLRLIAAAREAVRLRQLVAELEAGATPPAPTSR